jgi:hypothetical protein
MKKAISVSLAKIDYNLGNPHMYILADCPMEYQFCGFDITVYMINSYGNWVENHYNASSVINGKEDIILNLPISSLHGVTGPAIYRVILKAEHVNNYDLIDDTLYLSDAHGVYRNLLNGLTKDITCGSVDDEVVKQYLMLYAHEAALLSGDIDVAKDMFKLMHKNFNNCGRAKSTINDCGCHD